MPPLLMVSNSPIFRSDVGDRVKKICASRHALANSASLADILNYALTLEHLEDTFYRQGLANFTQADFAKAGYDATFYGNIKRVSGDESDHVSFLTSALKGMLEPAQRDS